MTMTENTFESNLRAPIAYRDVDPDGHIIGRPTRTRERSNDWCLHHPLPTGENLKALVLGYNLSLVGNKFRANGLQFDKDSVLQMLCAGEPREKKMRAEENAPTESGKYPDGESLLVIKHCIARLDSDSFPEGWYEGVPFEGFTDDYCQDEDEYGDY